MEHIWYVHINYTNQHKNNQNQQRSKSKTTGFWVSFSGISIEKPIIQGCLRGLKYMILHWEAFSSAGKNAGLILVPCHAWKCAPAAISEGMNISKFSTWILSLGMVTQKCMQFIRIMSRPPSRIRKCNQLNQFRWTSTNLIPIYRKGLSWLHFDDEPRVQERQQVKDQHSCISFFVAYPTTPSSN